MKNECQCLSNLEYYTYIRIRVRHIDTVFTYSLSIYSRYETIIKEILVLMYQKRHMIRNISKIPQFCFASDIVKNWYHEQSLHF